MSERRETGTVDFTFDGGLLTATFREGADVRLADALEHVEAMRELTRGEKVPVLIDLRGARAQDREARATYASDESSRYTRSCALLVGSPLTRVLGSFFLGLNKPKYPTRLFTSRDEAVRWLTEAVEHG